ncbi:tRNA uridine-5-carboxymethylaminomethyl(34) synthesis GTPase MnmE [Allofustis seminis]|uniref:tRNA uridine-5-carboxymethylaminomethyl(34) synthesis GTPase MnmE n=1 Tax=Allofustis seminis TaxID=166939 RepID=UPI00036534ED|nr:tRNA uridine-5-carboxymethylaminomethyl(34) synthesis GTPase MnmE [Allofustis seminis]
MTNQYVDDTIAAISTPPGEGGISIVRLSGGDALAIADKLYHMGRKSLKNQDSHTIHYGYIMDGDERVDEVMVSIMKAPRTYTVEDVVEINTHGGMVATQRVLELCLKAGARLAEPGEFTKRAFLNGRIDLSQAEAVMDVIQAKTDRAMKVAMKQLQGNLAEQIRILRQQILATLAQVEVNIDYPEYDDIEEMTTALIEKEARNVQAKINDMLQGAREGKILRDGLKAAIVGRPNVGKSSLLNTLLKEEKAIVTNIEGTTRDVIEEFINIKGVPLHLIDTAGIRDTEDIVEKIGVERSREVIEEADLILLVIDQSSPLTAEDIALLEQTEKMERLVLLNKQDLAPQLDLDTLMSYVEPAEVIELSLMKKSGVDRLEEKIAALFFSGKTALHGAQLVSNIRHIALLEKANQALDDVLLGIEQGMPVDLVQIDFTSAWELLGNITGETVQDELLDQLFSRFCLGK